MHPRSFTRVAESLHGIAYGCATGEFRVKQGLATELAQGLFAQPRVYSAFVRFSNSAPWPQPDTIPHGRGLALQVENELMPRLADGASGRTQDFVMVNHATFIARDVKDYLRLQEARLQATQQPTRLAAKLLTTACHPFQWRWRDLLAAAQVARQPPSHVASYIYYSMVPIRFGRFIAKYRVSPQQQQPNSFLGKVSSFLW